MKVVFAGGGTGGHLMAGLSIAQEISSRFPDTDIVFFGTNKKNESGFIEKSGYEFKQIKACKLTSFIRLPVFVFISLIGIIHSIINIIRIKPDIIVGLGGYGSVSPVIAAYIIGVPIVLIEQNVIPGGANLIMARWVDAILCHWEDTTKRFKKAHSISVTGIPVRKNVIKSEIEINNNPFGLAYQKKTLLIMGGSQGAQAINKVILQSVPKLKTLIPDLQIIHFSGKHGYKEIKATYDNIGIKSFVSEFFDDIGIAYGLSDVVICRAGANTVAEITAVGIPAIFIPYPYATDNHQYWNAYELARMGGALIIKQDELKPEKIVELVSNLLTNDEKLNNMKKINSSLSKPFAAAKVVEKICQILEKKKTKNEPYFTKLLSGNK
ncbi:MAG: UDP-N-acetylglucosamine--N-acetylmuramyl- (pentapeptide) pyrophosphoryl-undecaprenol N-acetylglucosamine transferase [Candidatus Scalindua rubra]|uniref:UDP-N-acetylglucosamine--N-acetylmuramyl-(pentapeptide) pyrophosphoryl-undecaprenol N-acetylglucosamine transferase n=1 Tax=Candidatus Scalindua rubra TaxID=1872076 RepID=A0A1E3XCV0_9BACT|nr:MAG: UDP-N-acetylglucosamine--N-acetylmuramyl- (pentapeptide) pyrophosphoryl-undecaprenol N-acetylglucosamine transferase [Candidatus Scalindua rubra]